MRTVKVLAFAALFLLVVAPSLTADTDAVATEGLLLTESATHQAVETLDGLEADVVIEPVAGLEWLAGDSDEIKGISPTETHYCFAVSNWCSSCSAGKVKSCTRYRCQIGPDIWYQTSCTSCGFYC